MSHDRDTQAADCMAWRTIKSWWRHQMEIFSALLALCAGNSPVPVNSPHKGQWRGALVFSLICARINDWVNNREAGDLRHHRGHYDVNVLSQCSMISREIKGIGVTNQFCPFLYFPRLSESSKHHFPSNIPFMFDTYRRSLGGVRPPFKYAWHLNNLTHDFVIP